MIGKRLMTDSPDVTAAKSLLRRNPHDWVEYLLGRKVEPRAGPISVKFHDLHDEIEGVLRIWEPDPWIVHVTIQAEYDPELPLKLLTYNSLLQRRKRIPVWSVAVLLRPAADGPAFQGCSSSGCPTASFTENSAFRSEALAAARGQTAGRCTGHAPPRHHRRPHPGELPAVIRTIRRRISEEDDRRFPGPWAATCTFAGLDCPDAYPRREHWLERAMKDSSIYQVILQEGREERCKQGSVRAFTLEEGLLIRFGTARFGPPDPSAAIRILEATFDRTRIGPSPTACSRSRAGRSSSRARDPSSARDRSGPRRERFLEILERSNFDLHL